MIFTLEDPKAFPLGDEPIRGGRMCGWLTSAAYGPSLGRAVGTGHVRHAEPIDRAWLEAGTSEIEIAGDGYRAMSHLRPPFGRAGSRIHA